MWSDTYSPTITPGTTLLVIIALALCLALPAAGHESMDESIDAVSAAIERSTEDPALYLHRAELHRLHGNRETAAADLARAAELGAEAGRLALCRAALDLDMGRPSAALVRLNAAIDDDPGSLEAHRLRARVRAVLGDNDGAITDLDRGLALSPSPGPEVYLERARLQTVGGVTAAAVTGLDEGIKRLGPVVSLVLAAVDLETELGRYDDALNHLQLLDTRYQGRTSVLVHRAGILELAGRKLESLDCYTEALARVEELPPSRRTSPATIELERKLRQALKTDNQIQPGDTPR